MFNPAFYSLANTILIQQRLNLSISIFLPIDSFWCNLWLYDENSNQIYFGGGHNMVLDLIEVVPNDSNRYIP